MGSPDRAEEQPMIEVESGVSLFTGKPFCAIRWGEMSGQLDPEAMRQHGLVCIATAEAAERDAAFVSFLRSGKDGMEMEEAAATLYAVRQHREES